MLVVRRNLGPRHVESRHVVQHQSVDVPLDPAATDGHGHATATVDAVDDAAASGHAAATNDDAGQTTATNATRKVAANGSRANPPRSGTCPSRTIASLADERDLCLIDRPQVANQPLVAVSQLSLPFVAFCSAKVAQRSHTAIAFAQRAEADVVHVD